MSLEAMVWALKHAPVPDAPSHLILIGLADHADGNGRNAWPAVSTLAEYARCSTRTVHNKLRLLEEAGVIRRGDQALVSHVRGDRRPVVYDLALDGVNVVHGAHDVNEVHVVDGHGVNGCASRGEQPSSHGVNAVAHKPSLNRTEPSITTPSPRPAATPGGMPDDEMMEFGFAAFWKAYPRKVGKQAARRAFVSVVRQLARETRTTVDLGAIVTGAERMAADPNLPGPRFVPHPSTWLNQRRWDDPPYPPLDAGGRSTTDDRVQAGIDLARRLAEQEGRPNLRAIGGDG